MKRMFVFVLLASLLVVTGFSRAPYTEFKVGKLNPKNTKAGTIFGLTLGRMIDESLSWGVDIGYFQRTYRQVTTVAMQVDASGNVVTQKELNLEFTTRLLPILFKLSFERPLGYRSALFLRGSAGLGWELLWNKENNYQEGKKSSRFFNGFGWQASGGLGFAISSSANLFADLFYNGSKVKRNQKVNESGLPTWEELDVSGWGFRIGVSIVGFGW